MIYRADPEGGYIAVVPQLPGCHTQGATLEQAEERISEAVEVYLASLKAHREERRSSAKIFVGSIAVSPSV